MVLSRARGFLTALDRDSAMLAAERLKVFAQGQRLMILSSLIEGELSVSAIEATTGVGQPALSQQLAELRRAELVAHRREAKQMYYRLADARTMAIVRFIGAVFAREGEPSAALEALDRPVTVTRSVQSAAVFAVVDR